MQIAAFFFVFVGWFCVLLVLLGLLVSTFFAKRRSGPEVAETSQRASIIGLVACCLHFATVFTISTPALFAVLVALNAVTIYFWQRSALQLRCLRLRKWLVAALVVNCVLVVASFLIDLGLRRQFVLDDRVAEETHQYVERRLPKIAAEDRALRVCGKFDSWKPIGWSRPSYYFMFVSRLEVRGIAHFEDADVPMTVYVTHGTRSMRLDRSLPDDFLAEKYPDANFSTESRRLMIHFGEPAAASGAPISESPGEEEVEVTAWVAHPDFVAE